MINIRLQHTDIMRFLKKIINKCILPFGIKIERINIETDFEKLVVTTLTQNSCDLVIDIGANTGQFAQQIISRGYTGNILSFEPLLTAHKTLQKLARKYKSWSVEEPVALGDENTEVLINVSENSVSSSILAIGDLHTNAAASSGYVGTQVTKIRKLSDYQDQLHKFKNIYLKIDTQGFELNVLKGIGALINKIEFIQLEVSFVELYTEQCRQHEIEAWMTKNNFEIWSIERGFSDPATGQTLQADYIYRKLDD